MNDEEFVDEEPRSKVIRIPKMPSLMDKIGIQKIIELLSRGAEMIIQEGGQEVMRVELDN